jgi:hypothetical protein
MKFIKRTQRFISDYLPIKVSKEDIRFIVIFLFFIFAVIFLVSFIEYHRQKFWRLISKISGFRMFSNTPLFHPCQKPQTYHLYNAHNYCKIRLSGGLAQLVEQRTLKILLREWIDRVELPCNTSKQSFSSVNFSEYTTAHHT